MPRSAANKRRRKSPVQVSTTPPQDLEVEDASSSGCVTEEHHQSQADPTKEQWMDMLIQEDGDEAVAEVIDELMSKVMEGCLQVDVKRQLESFCASWAKSYFTQMLDQQIMCLDEGEAPEESSRTEDSEPIPVMINPWVQGCVPVVNPTPKPHPASLQEADLGQVPAQAQPTVSQQCNVMARSPKQSEKETSPRRSVSYECNEVLCPRPPSKTNPKKKQQVKLLPKPVPGKLLPPLSCAAEPKDVDVKAKDRTQSVSTGSLYQHKNYQPLPKLDPSYLPRHCIIPQYEIVDDTCTKLNSKKPNGLPKLKPSCNKHHTECKVTSSKQLTGSVNQPTKFQRKNEANVCLKKLSPTRTSKATVVPSSALRLDVMVLAEGVSLLDPQAAEMKPLKCDPPTLSTKLRPIRSDVSVPLLSVDQVIAGEPRVTPL